MVGNFDHVYVGIIIEEQVLVVHHDHSQAGLECDPDKYKILDIIYSNKNYRLSEILMMIFHCQ